MPAASHQVQNEGGNAVFVEHAWDMRWCDPCAANPLSTDELRQLGVLWADASRGAQPPDVFVTRLHVRYDKAHFPEDLVFQEAGDRANFQGGSCSGTPGPGTTRALPRGSIV